MGGITGEGGYCTVGDIGSQEEGWLGRRGGGGIKEGEQAGKQLGREGGNKKEGD